ncbi:MAG TPA: hypothetical protein VK772_02175 [Puia sp.]|nr:hypothetical protein [Puia sp.]
MKKILVNPLVIICAIFFLAQSAAAASSIRPSATGNDSPNIYTIVADMNSVNKKAATDFKDRFGNPAGTRWFSDEEGFTSYFKVDGFTDKVCYDKKGNWKYSTIYYGESKIPKNVRAEVKSIYYDMSIIQVEEVQTLNGKGYVINLEDQTTIRIIKLNEEGEMEIIQEIIK